MAYVVKDRVRETTSTSGTGAIFVSGVVSGGYRTFNSVLSNGDTTPCLVRNAAGQWQTFLGTWNSATQSMARTTPYDGSSGAGVNVNFSGESQEIWIDFPAYSYGNPQPDTLAVGTNAGNWLTISGGATSGSNGDATISTAGSATNSHLLLTTKGATSLVRGNRPLLFSMSSDLNTLASLRNSNTAAWFHNNITYAGAVGARFTVTGALAGTTTGSTFDVNSFTHSSDNANADSAGGLTYLYVSAAAGGTNFKGNRTGITAKVNITTAAPNQSAFKFITGISGGAYTSVNPGTGVGFGYDQMDGYIFGGLLQARAETGGRFVRALQGLELNVGNQESAVPVLDMNGVQVVMENGDVGPWMRQAVGYGLVNQTAWTGQGYGIGFAWQQANGQFALNRTYGAVLGGVDTQYGTAPETAFGVDFFSLSLTRAHLRGYQNRVLIDGAGNVGGQIVAGTTLQTRSSVVAKTCGVSTITVVDGSLFLTKPTLTVGAPPGGGTQATANINTMAAAYMRALTGGTGYAVNDTVTLSGGTFTSAAVFTVKEVSAGGVPTRLQVTTPGSYTVLPASPISTTTSGSGTGLTLSVWWTALTVTVTAAGDSYPEYPPPPVTAAYTLTGGDRSPLRRMEFAVAMTATQTTLALNPGAGLSVTASALGNYANDAAAAAGGVPVNGVYRNGSVLMVRVV